MSLNQELLEEVQKNFKKEAFVPMPGGGAEPVAGASVATAGMGAPMGMPAGGDPNAAAAQGGMPAPMPMGGDPAMMGMGPDGAPIGGPMMGPDGVPVDPMTGQPIEDPAAAGGAPAPEGEAGMDPVKMIEEFKQELPQLVEEAVTKAMQASGQDDTKELINTMKQFISTMQNVGKV
jgi:hypothetical protein